MAQYPFFMRSTRPSNVATSESSAKLLALPWGSAANVFVGVIINGAVANLVGVVILCPDPFFFVVFDTLELLLVIGLF